MRSHINLISKGVTSFALLVVLTATLIDGQAQANLEKDRAPDAIESQLHRAGWLQGDIQHRLGEWQVIVDSAISLSADIDLCLQEVRQLGPWLEAIDVDL